MESVYKEDDSYGQSVIYVSKCSKYSYEDPETPKNPIFMYTDFEENEMYDTIDIGENCDFL